MLVSTMRADGNSSMAWWAHFNFLLCFPYPFPRSKGSKSFPSICYSGNRHNRSANPHQLPPQIAYLTLVPNRKV